MGNVCPFKDLLGNAALATDDEYTGDGHYYITDAGTENQRSHLCPDFSVLFVGILLTFVSGLMACMGASGAVRDPLPASTRCRLSPRTWP